MKESFKGLGLVSGGLDSIVASLLLKLQNIEIIGLNFTSPFCICDKAYKNSECGLNLIYEKLGMKLYTMNKGDDYLNIIKNPKYGHGRNLNPCIDCRIYIISKAKEFAKKIDADFIYTGEVLDQRLKSQNYEALKIIEKETNLQKKLVRPLSALHLEPTIYEEKGLIDRMNLLAIRGRSRKKQLEIARKYGILDEYYACGGCLLTDKKFSIRVKDLLSHHDQNLKMQDFNILKYGRHFRFNNAKVIVGRNELENKNLERLKKDNDLLLKAKNVMGPITLLRGTINDKSIEFAAKLTLRYSDFIGKEGEVIVKNGLFQKREIVVNLTEIDDYFKSFIL